MQLKHRLGMVTSFTARTFKAGALLMDGGSAIRLVADPIGSHRPYTSSPLLVAHGQSVRWQLENNLALSSFVVR
ncbi:MAG: hypothetical protein ACRELD_07250 [Longimicrobiales bacterium]